MGNRFLRLAVIYFLIGVSLGMAMAGSHNFKFTAVHAHINLLGWVSLALFGLFYKAVPAAEQSRLAHWHFWLYNIALPIQMISLAMFIAGNAGVETVVAISSAVVVLAFLFFAVNLFKHTR